MKSNRPINLDLATIKFPITAITSILHRISGVILLVGLIFLLCALDLSLSSAEGFASVKTALAENFFAKFILWGLLTALAYHSFAGVKHLIMDFDIGVNLQTGPVMAWLVVVLTLVSAILAGVWVW